MAAAFLPVGWSWLAFADDASDSSIFDPLLQEFFGFQRDTSQPTTVYSVSGEPPIYQSIHQTEFFGTDPTATLPAGLFQVDNEVITDPFGPASAELLVTSSAEGTSAPPVGSVYDVINIGSGFENFYSDIAPTTPGGPDTLSDTLVTPFANIPITTDLHAFLDPTDSFFLYGPTDPLAVASVNDINNASSFFDQYFQDFFGFEQNASQPSTVTDIAAIPPIYQSVHQTEFFDTASTGTLPAGWFEAQNNVLANTMGPDFSELLVTSSAEGTSAPPVGSVYEINNMAGGFENIYSDIAPTTPGGPDTLSDTLVTPFGNIPITTDLHAFLDPTDSFFPYGPTDPLAVASPDDTTGFSPTQPFAFFGFEQDASEPTTVTGVSGLTGVAGFLPSYDSVHLNEFFDTARTSTLPAGLFQADSNVITNATGGVANSEILVTSSEEGTSAPPVGSVYDVLNIGSGFENFYSDIAPTTPSGADTLADTLVTPFGDIPLLTDFHSFLSPMDLFYPF
ncbi:MAG: hypothetical protein WAN71_27960 [Mycobacterium sp.]|uniref:hypothetical protein n=1 Tax=Mycobacterium sp. TaxID=1785 RepID=UPI003BB0E9CF